MKKNNKLTDFEQENSPNIVVRVTDDSENFDENAECAVIIISPARKSFLLELREKLKTLKGQIQGVYDIRVWDYSPKFLHNSILETVTNDDFSYKVGEKEIVQVTDEIFNQLTSDDIGRCVVDVVLLQVSEDGFFWTGVYKHTSLRFSTSKIPFSLIENI